MLKNKNYKLQAYLALVSLIFLIVLLNSCQPVQEVVSYIQVVDGDTLKANGNTVRIIGIDTPETYSGSSKPVGEFGQDAKNYLGWFISNLKISLEFKGQDDYGRKLAYVFGTDGSNNKYLYEASVTELGYARPLFYSDNYVSEYAQMIINAYKSAYDKKLGIFSKWESAPVITSSTTNWSNYVGRIVWLDMNVENVYKYSGIWHITSTFATVKIRDEEYRYIFNNYNLYDLNNKKVKFYGELWNDEGKPTIMLRAPFEIVIEN